MFHLNKLSVKRGPWTSESFLVEVHGTDKRKHFINRTDSTKTLQASKNSVASLAYSAHIRKHDRKTEREWKIAERLTEVKGDGRCFSFFPIKRCKESSSEKIARFLRIVTLKPCKENACMHTAIQVKKQRAGTAFEFPLGHNIIFTVELIQEQLFLSSIVHTQWYEADIDREVHSLPIEAKLHS